MHRAFLWTIAAVCASLSPALASPKSLLATPAADGHQFSGGMQLSPTDRELVARAIIGEAAGEGRLGMAAVANVIRNRVALTGDRIPRAKDFGRTIPDVLKQFDAMNPRKGGPAYRMAWRISTQAPKFLEALAIVDDVFRAAIPDPTGGALFYYNPSTVRTPAWAEHFALSNDRQIGNHRFLGDLAKSAETATKRSFGNFLGIRTVGVRLPAPGLQG